MWKEQSPCIVCRYGSPTVLYEGMGIAGLIDPSTNVLAFRFHTPPSPLQQSSPAEIVTAKRAQQLLQALVLAYKTALRPQVPAMLRALLAAGADMAAACASSPTPLDDLVTNLSLLPYIPDHMPEMARCGGWLT